MDVMMVDNSVNEETPWQCMQRGEAPNGEYELAEISEGIEFITDFIAKNYFDEYICEGGSKIKFVTGRRGSGKSHLMNYLSAIASRKSFVTVSFSAHNIWLHDFKEIYLEILKQCDLMECLKACGNRIIRDMGYDPEDIAEDQTFLDYLSGIGEADPITKREIRMQLKYMFWDNPNLDNNFALCCSHLTGSILGHPMLESQNIDILNGWLYCDKSVRLLHLRALGLSPVRITKYNARHMLRSLAEVIHLGGYSGLMINIDDIEVLCDRSSMQPMRYTKMRREDTFESIRELIDEIDSMSYVIFFFGFDRELMDSENYGLKSYQALWMRIQNEIVGERFNRFSDIIDMDRLGHEIYDLKTLKNMAVKFANMTEENGKRAFLPNEERLMELLEQSRVNSIGLPLAVLQEVLNEGGGNNV